MFYSREIIGVLIVFIIAFIAAWAITPAFIRFLIRHKLGKSIRAEGNTPVFTALHQKKTGTPTMGGLIIWVPVLALALGFAFLAHIFSDSIFDRLNFLSREKTWLPIGAMVIAGIIGALDDILNIFKIGPNGGGLSVKIRLLLYTLVAVGGAWWLYYKLEWNAISIPGLGEVYLGLWYIPLFILVVVATSFSLNETDGLDGLAGGVALTSFGAYAMIAFMQGNIELTIFIAAILGTLLAFVWYNIYPAMFFMTDTGSMALGTTLGIIAMLTDTVFILPIIAIILVIESGSVIIQTISKKYWGRKIFLSTPIHHHFEALGWPETKVTMRFWIISGMAAAVGLIIATVAR
ncbi:MAG: phospho-N-acetylmuramoyl-pentapeptide-transferase [bacterium]|nr:phospho-N-acetylmuramoyl-pentapeptide-transferase [bacterium]